MNQSRRSVLKTGACALALGGLAGCLDDVALGSDGDAESGYAAFFTLQDWGNQVSGGEIEFDTPVDVGTAGHDWSPDSNVATDIAETDIFVYLDTPEFNWAQNAAETLEQDFDDLVLVDGLEGIELLEWDHEVDSDDGHGHDDHDDHDDHSHDDDHDDHDDHSHDDDHDDHDHDDDHDDHDHDDDHDHGEYDPHVWVDPVLAQQIVDNIANGLAQVDPDNEDEYEANAAEYNERLEDLDEQFQDTIENAERNVAVLAGHDSFTYLEERYGFELHTPVGVSPQDQPSQNEIAETIEFVNENGIETILYDPFEAEDLAETIVENSDATETAEITPAEGTTEEWNDGGWGYIEQMEEINLSALERALGSQ